MSLTFALLAAVILGAANAAQYGCTDENYNRYDVGPIDRGNPCEDCRCTEYGQIVCDPKNGPVDSSEPCKTCQCSYGTLSCTDVECPHLDCPPEFRYREYGDCCDKCKPACRHGYNWYKVGETVDRGHKCETCVCGEDYEVHCQHVDCPRLPCYPTQYLKDPEACCEHCPKGCQVGYAYYLVGETVDQGNKCETCQCAENGQVVCAAVTCNSDYLPCRPSNYVTPSGECCPTSCRYH